MNAANDALERTRQWLERGVIGQNLCPFAKAVHVKGQIRWVLSPARQPLELLHELVRELRALAGADPEAVDTTLLVCPHTLARFDEFVEFTAVAEEALNGLGLSGTLQIAHFHPRYRFAGVPARDPSHATNRAPYPTLHLLREASVTRAVAAYPDAEAIYGRNIETLRRLGLAGWRAVLAGGGGDGGQGPDAA